MNDIEPAQPVHHQNLTPKEGSVQAPEDDVGVGGLPDK
jgi:hypothetical protein